MTTTRIQDGGHWYVITTNDQGVEISRAADDPVQPLPIVLSRYQYRKLFTTAERIAIDNFQSNTNLTAQQKDEIAAFLNDFQIADTIPLADAPVVQGTQFLETCGLIAAGRAAQILANQPPPAS